MNGLAHWPDVELAADVAAELEELPFARGFEAGMLWAVAVCYPNRPVDGFMLRTDNAEMALRIAEATGRAFMVHDDDIHPDTLCAHFGPRGSR